jgi:hypothetical protein
MFIVTNHSAKHSDPEGVVCIDGIIYIPGITCDPFRVGMITIILFYYKHVIPSGLREPPAIATQHWLRLNPKDSHVYSKTYYLTTPRLRRSRMFNSTIHFIEITCDPSRVGMITITLFYYKHVIPSGLRAARYSNTAPAAAESKDSHVYSNVPS